MAPLYLQFCKRRLDLFRVERLSGLVLPGHGPLCETLERLSLGQTNVQLLQRHQQRENRLQSRTTRKRARRAEELDLAQGRNLLLLNRIKVYSRRCLA
jgi:hypothetical protein